MLSPTNPSLPGAIQMPSAVREAFDLLYTQINLIHANWRIYCQLYGTSPDRIAY